MSVRIRARYALAEQGMAPRIFAKVAANGVPIMALLATTVIAALWRSRGEAEEKAWNFMGVSCCRMKGGEHMPARCQPVASSLNCQCEAL